MNVKNTAEARDWFSVLQTNERTQTAVMTLEPGRSSGDEPEAHRTSDQVLLVLEGEVFAEVGSKTGTLRQRDVILIPAGTKHKFMNRSDRPCVTFNTYSPPAY